MKSRIGEIAFFLQRARKRGAKLTGKSAFEKELAFIISEPSIDCPNLGQPGIYGVEPPNITITPDEISNQLLL